MRARFIKADPLMSGEITYILKGEKTKAALHEAVELTDQEVVVSVFQPDIPEDERAVLIEIRDAAVRLKEMAERRLGRSEP